MKCIIKKVLKENSYKQRGQQWSSRALSPQGPGDDLRPQPMSRGQLISAYKEIQGLWLNTGDVGNQESDDYDREDFQRNIARIFSHISREISSSLDLFRLMNMMIDDIKRQNTN